MKPIERRTCLTYLAASSLGGAAAQFAAQASEPQARIEPKRVAAVVTAYEQGLHSDVLIGKVLEGWQQDGGPGPALKLSSMYVDQFTDKDLARAMSVRYGFPLFDTIEGALTVGGQTIDVDGVISVGEHGNYPWNDKEQHLYPRRRFFEEITDSFARHDRVVPVFSDKHLGPVWSDAAWMYERATALRVPFMAGSSLPVSFRTPEIDVPLGSEIEAAVGIGYSGLDIYGSHSLECFQALVERRRGAETGVQWVQCLQGEALWKAVDEGLVANDAFEAALAVTPKQEGAALRSGSKATLFLIQYADGLLGCVLMLPEYAGGISVGLRIKGTGTVATRFEERAKPHPHFAWLLKGIERLVHTGRPSYPVERTLLTSGILDRALTSLADGQRRLDTPELAIRYQPADYPHAPLPSLDSDPCASP